MRELFLSFAPMRSGQHAVINWILAHFKSTCFLNAAIVGGKLATGGGTYALRDKEVKQCTISNIVFISFEDQSIIYKNPIITNLEIIGSFTHMYHVIILRDPFNMFASRIAYLRLNPRSGMRKTPHKHIRNIWKEHAKEFLGQTNYLSNKICVNYNKWFTSKEYRDSILEQKIDDEAEQKILNRQPKRPPAAVSSFDRGREFIHHAQKMKVLDRWQQIKQYDEFEEVYKPLFDQEIIDLSRQIFGNDFVNKVLNYLSI